MLDTFIGHIKDEISDLPFVHRYGGLVRTARRLEEIGENQYLEQIFPVSCDVNENECWEDSRYLDLVPNEDYASIFYFEQVGGLKFRPYVKNGNTSKTHIEIYGNVVMVGWVNMPKLGHVDKCHLSDLMIANLLTKMEIEKKGIQEPFPITKLSFKPVAVLPKDYKTIFGKYTYNGHQGAFLYPFDYFALQIEVKAIVGKRCLPDFVPGVPVECEFV